MVAKTENDTEFSFTKWLAQGIEGVRPRRVLPCLMPAEFRKHVRMANREMLLAWRSILDKAIERMEQEEPAPKKVTKIKVE